MGETCLTVKVGHETLEFAYVYVLAGLAEHTRALALTLMTTHAATHGGEVAARVDDSHRVAKVTFGKLGYPFGDVVADGTSFLAGWHFAVKASLGLTHGLGKRIVFGDFLKLVHLQTISFQDRSPYPCRHS